LVGQPLRGYVKYLVQAYETRRLLCEYLVEANSVSEARENAVQGIVVDREVLLERELSEPMLDVINVEQEET